MTTRPGLTLVELIIAASISAAMFILLSRVTFDSLRIYRNGNANTAAASKVNTVVAGMVRNIRQSQPSPTGAYPVVAASGTSITFFASTTVPGVIQQVRYFLNGTDLQMGSIQPTGSPVTYPAGNEVITTILANVRNGAQPVFQYYTGAYTGSQAAMNPIVVNSIRYLTATILYDEDLSELPSMTTITLGMTLRNLKDNY